MSRSLPDATRFTATGPHAHAPSPSSSRPPPSASTSGRPNASNSAPLGGETPAQKVARLRRARDVEKAGRVSGFDRIVGRGRAVADRAHRAVALGLIGLTALSGLVAVYALTDMVLYNRKKRRIYFAEQAELHSRTLAEAQVAEREGRASELQLAFLASEREKEGIRAEAERAEREREIEGGWGKRAKKWLVGGLKSEDVGAVEGGLVAREEGVEDEGGSKVGILRQVEQMQREETGFTRLTSTKEGGILDRIGEEAARDLGERKRGWISWVTGR